MNKRHKYRYYIGWFWKFIGLCKHCGSNDLQDWDDYYLGILSRGHAGKLCNNCHYITIKNL